VSGLIRIAGELLEQLPDVRVVVVEVVEPIR
jgi:hypothetical protein